MRKENVFWIFVGAVCFAIALLYASFILATEVNSVKLGDTDTRIRKGGSGIEMVQRGAVTATLPATGTGLTLPSGAEQTITAAAGLVVNTNSTAQVRFPTTGGLTFVPATVQAINAGSGLYLNNGANQLYLTPTAGIGYVPSTAQVIDAAGDSISANASLVILDPAADLTLTSTPTIPDGTIGQILMVTCLATEIYGVTLQDADTLASSNLQLGAATRAVKADTVLSLVHDGTAWKESAFVDSNDG